MGEIGFLVGLTMSTLDRATRTFVLPLADAPGDLRLPPQRAIIAEMDATPGQLEHFQLIDVVEFSRRMSRSSNQIAESINRNRVFFVECAGTRLFPEFFADRRYKRHHLYEVCAQLGDLPGGSKVQFFSTPKPAEPEPNK